MPEARSSAPRPSAPAHYTTGDGITPRNAVRGSKCPAVGQHPEEALLSALSALSALARPVEVGGAQGRVAEDGIGGDGPLWMWNHGDRDISPHADPAAPSTGESKADLMQALTSAGA